MYKQLFHGILFFWLLLPNFVLLYETQTNWHQAAGLLLISFSLMCLPAVVTGNWRIFYLLNTPVALISGFVAGYIYYYHIPVTIGLAYSVFDTNYRESFEVFRRYFPAAMISASGFITYLILSLKFNHGLIKHRSKLVTATLWALLLIIYCPYLDFELHERFNVIFNNSFIRNAWPYSLSRSAYRAWMERSSNDRETLSLPAVKMHIRDGKEIYVLVIGESVRNESFYNEVRSSNWLDRYDNLVYYHDVLTQANFTSLSIKMLLSGAELPEAAKQQPSLIQWQKAAGCFTAVLSNNTSYDFKREADIVDSEGDSGVTHYTRFDHDLLPIAASLIRSGRHKRLCIILHMVGSHSDYSARYDSKFSKYPLVGDEITKLRAAYKNTIVALQDFLDGLIQILKQEDEYAFLAYVSDHGENLMEINGLKEHVTMTPTRYELKVPMLFWASKTFINNNGERWKNLRENRQTPVSNAYLMPTFLDAMGILNQVDAAQTLLPSLFSAVRAEPRYYVTPDMAVHQEQDMLK